MVWFDVVYKNKRVFMDGMKEWEMKRGEKKEKRNRFSHFHKEYV